MLGRVLALTLMLAACRDPSPTVTDASASVPSAKPEPTPDVGDATVEVADAARPVRPDGGARLDPACDGPSLALLDPRCDLSLLEWSDLHPEKVHVSQEAKRDGASIVFSLVNRGPTTIDLPLRFDDREPGRSFEIIAELGADAQGVFVLAPPKVAFEAGDSGVHLHSTRIRLPPGGRASARLTPDLHPTSRLDNRPGTDGGTPRSLEDKPLILHVGQALTDVDVGEPAKVSLSNDSSK